MQNHIKERILGSTILLGGGILLSAMLFGSGDDETIPADTVVVTNEQVEENSRATGDVLTVDYETEQRILAEKREERAKQIDEREQQINDMLKAQTEARAMALAKAQEENSVDETVTLQPAFTEEQIQAQADKQEKTKQMIAEAQAESQKLKELQREKDEQDKLRQLQQEKEALLAQQRADERKLEEARIAKEKKQKQELQRKRELEKIAAEKAKKVEEKAKKKTEENYVAARNKLKQARKNASNSDKKYAVQVALASDQQSADDMAARLKKYGYKVTTSKTSRGVRVVVGPEKGQSTATALRDKLEADKRINVNGAWVTAYDRVHKKAEAKKTAPKQEVAKKDTAKASTNNDTPAEDKYTYGVQVAMAGDAESRDALVSKLKKAGYKVSTSDTSRGTRIIVGAGKSKEEARKLQKKINSDSRVGISGAWVKRQRKPKG